MYFCINLPISCYLRRERKSLASFHKSTILWRESLIVLHLNTDKLLTESSIYETLIYKMLYVYATKVRISRSLDLDVPQKLIEDTRTLFLK